MKIKCALPGPITPYHLLELSSDSCEVPTEENSQCRSPHWAQSAVLLEEPGPQLLCRETHTQKPSHCIGYRELVPFFEILPSALFPRHPGQSGLGFSPAVSAPREAFCWDPGFSYCQHPRGLAGWGCGGPASGHGCQRRQASLGLSPSHLTHFNLGQITKMLCVSSSSSAG